MPKVALIARSTLYTVPGGDTVQVCQTARHLAALGYDAQVILTHEAIDHQAYQLFHFFNLTRPADILPHLGKIRVPIALSPILIDYSEYDRTHRKGITGSLLRLLPASMTEYLKTTGRWLRGRDKLPAPAYLWKGQEGSIRSILSRTSLLLPNAEQEAAVIRERYDFRKPAPVIPNGIDPDLFKPAAEIPRDPNLIVCAARIEGIKNQLNLIKALQHTRYELVLAGSPAPNQADYYRACRIIAGKNVRFAGRLSQPELADLFARAAVHAMPSWFETCGLSSLEAAAMGCRPVISDRGYTRDYFGTDAFYADPGDPASIREAVEQAAAAGPSQVLQQRIREDHTWAQAASRTASAYDQILCA